MKWPFATTWTGLEMVTLSEKSHSNVGYKTESNRRTEQTKTRGHRQESSGDRTGGAGEVTRMVPEGDATSGGDHTTQYTDDLAQNRPLETYMMLFTNVTPIN